MRMLGWLVTATALALVGGRSSASAGELEVRISGNLHVTRVGVINRWDADGNARRAVNPKAKIDAPYMDATAVPKKGYWVFPKLPAGRYDVVIFAEPRIRIEGFGYPPVLEFDDFITADQKPDEKTRALIADDIAQSRHYENKVTPLFMAGNKKIVRVLVQLLRDKKTSYDGHFGQPVATLRHEIWQYTNRYGAWTKEKRTRVLDRLLMGRADLRRWTWVWSPALGNIEVPEHGRTKIEFRVPAQLPSATVKGLGTSS